MADKVQKIREEVQRLQDLTMDKNKNFYSEAAKGEYNALCNIEHFIDSLQEEPTIPDIVDEHFWEMLGEEPVSEDTMTIRKEWFEHCKESWYNEGYIDGKYNRDRQFKEPVSEDLEEACEQLAENARKHKAETSSPFFSQTDYRQGVIDGANWQKEQLLEKAVDGKVLANGMGNPILHLWDKGRHLINKKVKVIVIKED